MIDLSFQTCKNELFGRAQTLCQEQTRAWSDYTPSAIPHQQNAKFITASATHAGEREEREKAHVGKRGRRVAARSKKKSLRKRARAGHHETQGRKKKEEEGGRREGQKQPESGGRVSHKPVQEIQTKLQNTPVQNVTLTKRRSSCHKRLRETSCNKKRTPKQRLRRELFAAFVYPKHKHIKAKNPSPKPPISHPKLYSENLPQKKLRPTELWKKGGSLRNRAAKKTHGASPFQEAKSRQWGIELASENRPRPFTCVKEANLVSRPRRPYVHTKNLGWDRSMRVKKVGVLLSEEKMEVSHCRIRLTLTPRHFAD